MMLGLSTESISHAWPTFDSTVLARAESSHKRSGQKLGARFTDSYSMPGRSLTTNLGGQFSVSVGLCTTLKEEGFNLEVGSGEMGFEETSTPLETGYHVVHQSIHGNGEHSRSGSPKKRGEKVSWIRVRPSHRFRHRIELSPTKHHRS